MKGRGNNKKEREIKRIKERERAESREQRAERKVREIDIMRDRELRDREK